MTMEKAIEELQSVLEYHELDPISKEALRHVLSSIAPCRSDTPLMTTDELSITEALERLALYCQPGGHPCLASTADLRLLVGKVTSDGADVNGARDITEEEIDAEVRRLRAKLPAGSFAKCTPSRRVSSAAGTIARRPYLRRGGAGAGGRGETWSPGEGPRERVGA